VWTHDLQSTSRFTDLWPLLLVLALLLWPLDIALRRVSLGRRELADGRAWVIDRVRGRRVARRTAETEDLFAARGRAGSAGARAAIVREASQRGGETPGGTTTGVAAATAGARPEPATPRNGPGAALPPPPPITSKAAAPGVASKAAAPSGTPPPPADGPAARTSPPPASGEDTLSRLREAKRRSRG